MDIVGVTNEELQNRKIAEERKFRDRCAIAAMQSLIQVYASLDENGYAASAYDNPANFQSLAGRGIENGLGYPPGHSVADSIATESYSIARAMLVARDEEDGIEDDEDFEEEIEEDGDAKTTQDATGS